MSSKDPPGVAASYNGYYKRQEALLRQLQAKGMYINVETSELSGLPLSDEIALQFMNPHLVPTRVSWNGGVNTVQTHEPPMMQQQLNQ